MSTPSPVKFEKAAKFLDDKASAQIEFTAVKDQKVALALVKNERFPMPADGKIELGGIQARAQVGKEIAFKGKGGGKVAFSAEAGAFIGMGVYSDPDDLLASLELDDNIAPGIALEQGADSIYLVLKSGYDLKADAKGSVAMGAPGSVTFSAEGKREAAYAIVRRFGKEIGARDAVTALADSWLLPTQIGSDKDIDPQTWIIAEVDGSIALGLGVRYGYDFNWVRESRLGGITGDIGLRVQLGVAATLGFEAGGKFALVVGRESAAASEKLIRLRLFKQRTRKWSFAFNAGASVKLDAEDFLPEQLDDFIASIFTVHGAQIVKALEAIDKWTDPDKPVIDLLAEVSTKYARDFLETVTGIDPKKFFDDAKAKLKKFLDTWNNLDHRVASLLWKQVEKKIDLAPVRDLARLVAEFDRADAKKHIGELLKDVAFFDKPAGEWLESAAAGGIMRALNNGDEFGELQKIARRTLDILDGDEVKSVLVKLQDYINKKLGIDQIENAVNKASFEKADEWLKRRIAAFLGVKFEDLFAKVEEVRKAISTIRGRSKEFWAAARKALTRKYEAQFTATFQKETAATALIDVVFDFGVGVTKVRPSLQEAIDGKFDGLLVERREGVTLREATLTHQIKRQSHLELNMPFFSASADRLNDSLAKVKVVEDDGRVLLYELEATDEALSEANARIYRNSRLSIGATWPHRVSSTVRVHATASLTYDYSLRQARRAMRRADLESQLQPYIFNYFPHVFSAPADGGASATGSFKTWVGDMDRIIDSLPDGGPDNMGTDKFGNTLISLRLTPESEALTGWLDAPAKKNDPLYMEMSRRLQRKLKELVIFYYFQNRKHYEATRVAAPLLIYASIPPSTSIKVSGNKLTLNTDEDVYWNWVDDTAVTGQRDMMTFSTLTRDNLIRRLIVIHGQLLATPGMEDLATFYDPDLVGTIFQMFNPQNNDKTPRIHLGNLLFNEATFIEGARAAGVKLAEFFAKADSKPTEAIERLAKFGAKATQTFNSSFGGVFGGGILRPMGTLLFVEAALTLAGKPATASISAMLDLLVLKQTATFALDTYTKGKNPEAADILYRQRLVNL